MLLVRALGGAFSRCRRTPRRSRSATGRRCVAVNGILPPDATEQQVADARVAVDEAMAFTTGQYSNFTPEFGDDVVGAIYPPATLERPAARSSARSTRATCSARATTSRRRAAGGARRSRGRRPEPRTRRAEADPGGRAGACRARRPREGSASRRGRPPIRRGRVRLPEDVRRPAGTTAARGRTRVPISTATTSSRLVNHPSAPGHFVDERHANAFAACATRPS